ncbi:hypothetical protein LguiB_020618 [Lonicera macranthoides]
MNSNQASSSTTVPVISSDPYPLNSSSALHVDGTDTIVSNLHTNSNASKHVQASTIPVPLVDHVTAPTLDNMQSSPINSDSHSSPTIRTTNTTSNSVETYVPCTNQNQNHSHSSHNKSSINPPYPPAVHSSIHTSTPSISQTLGSSTSGSYHITLNIWMTMGFYSPAGSTHSLLFKLLLLRFTSSHFLRFFISTSRALYGRVSSNFGVASAAVDAVCSRFLVFSSPIGSLAPFLAISVAYLLYFDTGGTNVTATSTAAGQVGKQACNNVSLKIHKILRYTAGNAVRKPDMFGSSWGGAHSDLQEISGLCKAGTRLKRVWLDIIEQASASNFKTDINTVYADVILFLRPDYTPASATELICALTVRNTT